MRGLPVFALLMLGLLGSSFAVTVSDGGYSFSLESVKVLMRLMEMDEIAMEARMGGRPIPPHHPPRRLLCSNPTLPQELKPVCLEPHSDEIFARFVSVLMSTDPCEICANPACTGCTY
ncbi:guanylin-like [Clupea harengus]|uniref:Guanylate cyclase activator 2B n=1 Tax=Clupea harengus TaxID=7950 RepID=A0A6P3VXF5_CLUHA|nr:guanylin-like [Clupea harengus]